MKRLFESSVILDSSKTFTVDMNLSLTFESSVILDSSKTYIDLECP